MLTEIDGEELLRGSCDADDGNDKRDDVIRIDGDSFEVTHGGDRGEKEKTLRKRLRQQRTINRMGTSTPPTLGWRNLRANEATSSLTQFAAATGMP